MGCRPLYAGPGLIFTGWTIYYILDIAHREIKEDRQIM